jgi:hypothetical protein
VDTGLGARKSRLRLALQWKPPPYPGDSKDSPLLSEICLCTRKSSIHEQHPREQQQYFPDDRIVVYCTTKNRPDSPTFSPTAIVFRSDRRKQFSNRQLLLYMSH